MFEFHHHHRGRRHECGHSGRGRHDLKNEILVTLESGPRHGYDVMLDIEARTGERPGPGSIYPALQMLEDGDFVRSEERDGKRVYTITGKGRALLAQRPEREADADSVYGAMAEAIHAIRGIKEAARQIARGSDANEFKKAVKALERTRRELYTILAEEPAEE